MNKVACTVAIIAMAGFIFAGTKWVFSSESDVYVRQGLEASAVAPEKQEKVKRPLSFAAAEVKLVPSGPLVDLVSNDFVSGF